MRLRVLVVVCTFLLSFQLHAADYYWAGGAGNWSDLSHWHLGSAIGPTPSIVPSQNDNVFFDANSGFGTAPGANVVKLDANAFCNNMTWSSVPNNPSFLTNSTAFTIQIYGNLVLSSTTTYSVVFAFKGTTPATLTSNGTVLGEFGMEIDKQSSSLTLTDNMNVPATTTTYGTGGVTFTSGTFDISGKNVTIYQLYSDNANSRTLEMTNANLKTNAAYRYLGLNKNLNAAGSTLYTGSLLSDGGTYSKVTATNANGPNTIIINNTIFKALTFTPAGNIYSDIGNGNTVDTLVFNMQGSIGNNNTVGSVQFSGIGFIGTGNNIRKVTALNNLQVSGNTVDSLLLAPNRTTQFLGTFNLNKYLYVTGAPCDAYTEINGDSVNGTVNFAPGAVVDLSNIILTGVKATGSGIPFAVNGIDGGGNAGFTITEPSGMGTTYYWVGGSGDWNDKSHWSTTSGGTGGACIPFKNDNVVFDANSGLAGRVVTTSGTSFCNDITWAAGVGTTTFNESSIYSLRVYGSVVLQPNVTMNATLEFYGSSATTLTTNGGGTGNFQLYVFKDPGGLLTLLDDWTNATGGNIQFVSGGLSMAARTVSIWIFNSSNNITRNLDITNATIHANLRWGYLGANKSIVSTGSHITSDARFSSNSPGADYPWVDLTEIRRETTSDFNITNTTFGQLTFTSTSATSLARIFDGNVIRRLEFKGAGFIGNGTGNSIDSLILASSRNYVFSGTNTINKYFEAEATPCTGLTEIRSNSTSTLAFVGTTEVHIDNVYLQNMVATGPGVPYTLNGADAGGNSGWTINSTPGSAHYWVGGAGDWNDPNHWSTTSGGAPGACIPTISDDVYFDAGSGFTAVSKTVTISNGNAYCRNLNWRDAANAPLWTKTASWNMEVWGDSLVLNPAAAFNVSPVTLKGANATFMKGQVLGDFDVTIDKIGGSLTLLNNYSNGNTAFVLANGTFNAAGLALTVSTITNSGSNAVSSIDIHGSAIVSDYWNYSGAAANHTLNAANSSITVSTSLAMTGLQYDTLNVASGQPASAVMNAVTINRLTFTNTNPASAGGITGNNNTISYVEYKGGGGIYGTGNVMDTLVFFPGSTYTLNSGSNNIINDAWYGSGTPCRATEITSSGASNATITKNGDAVSFDYVRLQGVTAAGTAAPFQAGSHTTDLGSNVSWTIQPYDGAAPIQGLGPDYAIYDEQFPDTLHTDGFFGAPSSQYTWNDGSTADSLVITAPGTYSVGVSFPDGCAINDQIVVGSLGSLPITITSFTAIARECQSRLSWKTADALHFSRFVVEQSKDGIHYSAVGEISYTGGIDEYSYTHPAPANGNNFYRLKLVDIDGHYEYSDVVTLRLDCAGQLVQVYPTVTSGKVQVMLPQGFENALLNLVNTWGQQLTPVVHGNGAVRTVSLQGLPAGTYMLQLMNRKEMKTFKIIKQ